MPFSNLITSDLFPESCFQTFICHIICSKKLILFTVIEAASDLIYEDAGKSDNFAFCISLSFQINLLLRAALLTIACMLQQSRLEASSKAWISIGDV